MDKAKIERLALLMEECAEVQQVIGKILRHGEFSTHPDTPNITNRDLLEQELCDLVGAMHLCNQEGDINVDRAAAYGDEEYLKRKNKYLHFNEIKEY